MWVLDKTIELRQREPPEWAWNVTLLSRHAADVRRSSVTAEFPGC